MRYITMEGAKKNEMKLYTTNSHTVSLQKATLFDLSEAIEKRVTGVQNWVYGVSPGVIVENSQGGHDIYGLESRGVVWMLGDPKNKFLYGNLGSPGNLLELVGHGYYGKDSVANGCEILITTNTKKDRKYDWSIIISPDHDLRNHYPAKFNDSLVENLERAVSNYIEDVGVSDKVQPVICSETLKLGDSPISHSFYKKWGGL